MTRYVGVMGYPAKNTASFGIMNPLYQKLGIDIEFIDLEVPDVKGLPKFADYVRSDDVAGFIITMPYKQSIIPLLDCIDEEASRMKAINTIVKDNGKLLGTNTDSHGFLEALKKESGFKPENKKVTILGAGGAARGCGVILSMNGVKQISFVNRTVAKARELAEEIATTGISTQAIGYDNSRLNETVSNSDLIVNCSSFGMKGSVLEGQAPPLPEGIFREGQILYDTVYKPLETPLMKLARANGVAAYGGITMVIYVLAICFRMWHHQEAPIDFMYTSADLAAKRFHWK